MPDRRLAVATLLLSSQLVYAEELAPLIVTATRTAQTADETLSAVTVITREQIERQQAQSVPDLLRGTPGLSIANNGGPGKFTSVFLRGTESDHVLVLIDGVKVGSATAGTVALQDIPIEQIERIEVVRGPRSSLYGSEAIGGVIQIFTRKGGGALKPFLSLGGGSYQSYEASAGVSGGDERGWFNLGASGNTTAGFNACNGKPFPDGAGCFTDEPDRDGYSSLSGSARAGYRFENGINVDLQALRATSDNHYDSTTANQTKSVQQVLGGNLRYSPLDLWDITLAIGRSQDESDNYRNGSFESSIDTRRNTVSLQNDFAIGDEHLLTLGVDYQNDHVEGTLDYEETSRYDKGLFAQYQGSSGNHDVQLAVRRDDNEQFGGKTTGSAAWGYALSQGLRLTASYGTAFKAPTFNELYFPGFGNPRLRPETSRSLEFGLRGMLPWGNWTLNAYQTQVDDLIAYDAAAFAPANINKARIRGLEAVLAGRLANWDLNANLTLLDPENQSSGDDQGSLLPRRPRQSLRLDADRALGRYRFGATLLAEGKRYDDLANTRELGGYATVDLRAEYHLNADWRLQARVENLFDKDYETAAYYNQPGRGLYLTVRYEP